MWILKVLYNFHIKDLIDVIIFCDNEYAIKLVLNPFFHEKTKHFDVDSHFIREKVTNGVI